MTQSTCVAAAVKSLALGADRTLCYREISGDETRPCLVFLHDALRCIELWRDFPDQLCKQTGCPGLVYDRQGHGGSSPETLERTVHYLHHYALDELARVVDALLPGRLFILIGHSDGGSIALLYAARGDANLTGVITEAAHVMVEEEMRLGISRTIAAYEAGRLDPLRKCHGDRTDTVFYTWARTWSSDWFASWSIEYLLPAITCPVLAMQGNGDQYGTELQVDRIVAGVRGPAEKLMLDDCTHTPHHEAPEPTLRAMAAFVTRWGRTSGCP